MNTSNNIFMSASATVQAGLRFAFAGRVSTEDQQDPIASKNWQKSRGQALIEPAGGVIVADFFDIGLSRSMPWKRRPEAARLLEALKDPNRGFDAVVIGEPQRAFYGNQFSLTFPVFVHYGVQLWVPEVGGAIDPESEAHEMIMGVFGGMSKGERNRIKIRVRSAMAAQAKIEGRYLGGRPPYGYLIADAGPHPNPAKAADGKRLHRLERDPVAAPVVQRIFNEYIAGRGHFAIAEGLTRDGIASPSQHDPDRNRHRTGDGWAKAAVRAILINPRYTGRQVWNKQRKDEVLLNVEEVALGYETKMRWNDPTTWIWSDSIAHEPLISTDQFETAQVIQADHGRSRKVRETTERRARRHHVLRGLLTCGLCERKMQAQISHSQTYYRCRYPREYALAQHVQHPLNVYVKERDLLPALDAWIATAFRPDRLAATVRAMAEQDGPPQALGARTTDGEAASVIAACDEKLARYQAALDAGGDPVAIAAWTRGVQAERAAALARVIPANTNRRVTLTEDQIHRLISNIDDIASAIGGADPADKAAVYSGLNLRLRYEPGKHVVRARANLDSHVRGVMGCVRGGT